MGAYAEYLWIPEDGMVVLPPKVIFRTRLIERLNETASAGGTPGVPLISARAGFGKTTLVSEWVASCDRKAVYDIHTLFIQLFPEVTQYFEDHQEQLGDLVLTTLECIHAPAKTHATFPYCH